MGPIVSYILKKMNFKEGKGSGKDQQCITELPKIHTQRHRLGLRFKYGSTPKKKLGWLDMDGHFICSSEQSSPYLLIEPFKHNGKTYPGLEIFGDVIDVLAVEPKGRKLEKEEKEEKKKEKQGIKGSKVAEEEDKKEEQAAQEEGRKNKKASAEEEVEHPTYQVLKAIQAYIEESFEEAKSPSDILIPISDDIDCYEGNPGSTTGDVLRLCGTRPKLVAQATACGVCHMPMARAI
ncbi:hypothetical protein JCGZ_13567 [Jatropha curcas]|uniref:G-patch domain-containing protein n=1 Tax=Jatropha curcas TaxID=180498 RepID=A0A067KLI2_JATCU|nr:hypothetical protein JCGZ_13567 [Jatropha curcas]